MTVQAADHVRDRLLFQLDMELYIRQQEQATIERQLADAENTLRVLRQLQATSTYHETVHAYQTWFASGAAAAASAAPLRHDEPTSKSAVSSRRSTPANSPAITVRQTPAAGGTGGTGSQRTSRAPTPVPSAPPSPPRPLPVPLPIPIPAPPPSTTPSADSTSNSGTVTTATASIPGANQLLFVKLDDNSFIQMTCPNCDRIHFKSLLALVNHARTAHKVTYRSQMDFIRKFHTPVADSDVPLDHPCRTKPPISLSGGPLDLPTQPPPDRDVPQGEAGMTRFHYVRQVQVGSLSRSLPEAGRRGPPAYPGGPPLMGRGVLDAHTGVWHTHQWVAYVKESPWSEPCQVYVTRVRFHLLDKEQYPPPLDVVDVDEPPFSVTRTGRGKGFPVKVEVFFVDPDKNLPAVALFDMKMDEGFKGRDVQGHLAMLDVELDKDTDFTNRKIMNVPTRPPMSPSSALVVAGAHGRDALGLLTDGPHSPLTPSSSSPSSRLYPPIPNSITPYIHHVLPDFPLIHARPPPTLAVPYTVARTAAEFQSWPRVRQRAVEWLRARSLAVAIETQVVPDLGFDNQVRMKAARLTTKRLVLWLREFGFSPGVDVDTAVGPPDWAIEWDDDEDDAGEKKVCSGCGFLTNRHSSSTCPMVPLLPIPPPPSPYAPADDGQVAATTYTLDLRDWQPHIPMTLYDPRIAAMIESWIAPLRLPTFQSLAHMIGSSTRRPLPPPLPAITRPVAFRDPTGIRLTPQHTPPSYSAPPPPPPSLAPLHPAGALHAAHRRHQYLTDPALRKPSKPLIGLPARPPPPPAMPLSLPPLTAAAASSGPGARPLMRAPHPIQPCTHATQSPLSPMITRFDGTLGRREHTYALLGEVVQVFLRRLVGAAVDAAREERKAAADPRVGVGEEAGKQVLVPRHVAMGVVRQVQRGGEGRAGLEWLLDGWVNGGGSGRYEKEEEEGEEGRMDVDPIEERQRQAVQEMDQGNGDMGVVSVKTEPGVP